MTCDEQKQTETIEGVGTGIGVPYTQRIEKRAAAQESRRNN